MSAPAFLGLTATPFGVLGAFADGRVALLASDGTLQPYAHADYAALWPVAAPCGWVTGYGTSGTTTLCGAPCAPGFALCPTHALPNRAD